MPGLLEHWGYAGLFGLLLLGGLGFPIPEDVPLLISGYLLHERIFAWPAALVVALVGVVTADSMIYAFGATSRRAVRRTPRWLPVSDEQLSRVRSHFARHGMLTVMGARFAPGLRLITHYCAGVVGMSYLKFVLSDAAAALISVPGWMALGFLGASHLDRILNGVAEARNWAGAFFIAVLLVAVLVAWWRGQPNRMEGSGAEATKPGPAGDPGDNLR
jgi:membrane protein DedA with SNARE-associated domain